MSTNERNAGRKPIYSEPLEQVKVGLAPQHRATAQRLGSSLSDGIRKALEMAEGSSDENADPTTARS